MNEPRTPDRPRLLKKFNDSSNNLFQTPQSSYITSASNDIVCATPSQQINGVSNYKLGECLGKGASATVYKAMNYRTGQVVAIKQVDISGIPDNDLKMLMNEIDIAKELNHPNIVKYHGFEKNNDTLNIILEFCENGSLRTILKKFGKFPEQLVASYIYQVLQGLDYLHQQGTIHRDIKGANILTTKDGRAQLADFGVATQSRLAQHTVVGTPNWMAPEIIQLDGATAASDIWSLGCTIIELLTGYPPFHNRDPMAALFAIVQEDAPIPAEVSPQLNDFLLSCFAKDPLLRKTANELLLHPWIKQVISKDPVVQDKDLTKLDTTIKAVKEWNTMIRQKDDEPEESVKLDNEKEEHEKLDKEPSESANQTTNSSSDSLFEPNPKLNGTPNPFHTTTESSCSVSKYAESADEDFEDLTGELNLLKTRALRERQPNLQNISQPIGQKHETRSPSKNEPIDLGKYAETETDDEWKEVIVTDNLHAPVKHVNSNDRLNLDGFVDESFSMDDAVARAARENSARASKEMESLLRKLTKSHKEKTEKITHRMLHLLKTYPETRHIIAKVHGMKSLKLALSNDLTALSIEEILQIIIQSCKDDYKVLYQACCIGIIKCIIHFSSKHYNDRTRYLCISFIEMVCVDKTGIDMFLAADGLITIGDFFQKDASVGVKTVRKAVKVLWAIFHFQAPNIRSISCDMLSDHHLVSRLAMNLYRSCQDEEICKKITDLLLAFSEPVHGEMTASSTNSESFILLFQCYNSLPGDSKLTLLKVFKNLSLVSGNHQSFMDSGSLRWLCRVLLNSAKTSPDYKNIAWNILQTVSILCKVNPHALEETASTGIIPVLQQVAVEKQPMREFAEVLFDMASCSQRTRNILWKHDVLQTYLSLTEDPEWQIKSYAAIAAWIKTDTSRVERNLFKEDAQRMLLSGIETAKTDISKLLDHFYRIICHGPNLCSGLSKRFQMYSMLKNRLKTTNVTEIQKILQVLKAILDNNPNRVREFYKYKMETLLKELPVEKFPAARMMVKEILQQIRAFVVHAPRTNNA